MSFSLRTYLFLCLGLIAVAPVLLLGGLQTQRLAELQLAQSDRETSLAAEALAREVAQLMQTHSDAVEALSRQVEAQGGLDRQVALYRPGSDGDVELRSDTD